AAVHPVDRRDSALVEIGGDDLVREQHEIFDQRVRLAHARIVSRSMDVDRLTVVAEHDLGLGQIEVDRAAANAALAKDLRDLPQRLQEIAPRLRFVLWRRALAEAQRARDALIAQPTARSHYAFDETILAYRSLRPDVGLDCERQPILVEHQ